MKALLFTIILGSIVFLFCELLLRLYLVCIGYPFWQPKNALVEKFYPEVAQIKDAYQANKEVEKHVLLLGGSVISSGWSKMENRLDTLLPQLLGSSTTVKTYNAAIAGHSSRDNLLKYQLLTSIPFDLVIYYEAINENRANNIPYEFFKNDYSHIAWYEEIELLRAHPEINFSVVPFVFHKAYQSFLNTVTQQPRLEIGKVTPEYVIYGDSIQTAKPYRDNIEGIIALSKEKNERLLLMNYASFFPENITLTGEESDMRHFAGCQFACPISIWGVDRHVKKGIEVHNQLLREVAEKHQVPYFPFQLPANSDYFCDVCHVSEKGAVQFASELGNYIRNEGLLK